MSRKIVVLFAVALCVSAQNRWQERENALGTHLASQVRNETTPLDLPDVQAYIENLGRSLAPHLPALQSRGIFR